MMTLSNALAQGPPNPVGDWHGTLKAGGVELRLVLHINQKEDGSLKASLDSIDQPGANGIPVTSISIKSSNISMTIDAVHGSYDGKFDTDGKSIRGTWTQGQSLPLEFQRVLATAKTEAAKPSGIVKDAAELKHRRPQDPVSPYPYRSEDVAYPNPAANIQLAGTLTTPKAAGPFTSVLLITGSGPQDRDETLLGHKPFLVLSDYLTRHGIAVLRVDDRGIGKSGGKFSGSTTADFATDAEAGVAYLKTRADINPHKIGLIGHSEGGVIAPMIAARNPDIAFIVMMAGSGVLGRDIIVAQTRLISEAAGATHEAAEKNAAEEREILDLVMQNKDLTGKVPDGAIQQITSPWFRYFIAYDPAPALRKVKCPVLAIGGSKDLQVPPEQNLPAIRKALVEGGNQNIEVDELPGLNHLFQTAKTGAPSEYSGIEETLAPLALEKITAWVSKQ